MSDYQIQHQKEEDLFFVALDDGQRAYIKYRRTEDKSAVPQVDFWTTFVPESHRGQGLAGKLVEAGFAWAREQELDITASCWYAAKKLEQAAVD